MVKRHMQKYLLNIFVTHESLSSNQNGTTIQQSGLLKMKRLSTPSVSKDEG